MEELEMNPYVIQIDKFVNLVFTIASVISHLPVITSFGGQAGGNYG